jgi:hypothetical protein
LSIIKKERIKMKKKIIFLGWLAFFLTITLINANVALSKLNEAGYSLELVTKAAAYDGEISDPFPGFRKCWSGWQVQNGGSVELYCGLCVYTRMRTTKSGYCRLW